MKRMLFTLLAAATTFPLAAISPVNVESGRTIPGGVEFTLSSVRRDAVPVTVMLRTDGVVRYAEPAAVPAGRRSHRHFFSPEFLRAASGRKATLLLTAAAGTGTLELEAAFPGEQQPLPRPVSHGFYTDGGGNRHAWYMNHASEYVFDGEVYFPVGGMICPRLPGNTSSTPPRETPEGWQKRRNEDAEVFDRLLAHGIGDLYVNLHSWAEPAQIQNFVNLMESRGIRYGWQINAKNGGVIPAWLVTHDRADAPKNWQGAIRGEYRAGKVAFDFPREYSAVGFLLTDGKTFCRRLPYRDGEGVDVRKGIDVDDGKDFSKQRKITLDAELPLPEGTQLALIPLLAAKMRHPDLWNPAVRAEISQKFEWVKAIQWGPGFRFFVDPVVNEGNMLNATENLRQDTPEINAAFRRLLEEKYRTPAALREAWKCDVPDFAAASRLVPFRNGDALLLIDPETEKAYPADLASSLMWPDYNAMIRRSYAGLLDEVSAELRRLVDLPVVNKAVGVAAEELHIGGDGIGFEVYLNHGCPEEASGGGAVAAAAAMPHTVWKVATEAGFSAKPGNGGHRFFPDEKTLNDLADSLHAMGVNGFFFFGLKLPAIWKDHSVYDQPEKLEWLAKLKARFSGRPAAPEPQTFLYPAGYAWWYWSDRSRALYGEPTGEIVQSLRLPDGEWAYATHIPPESAGRVVLHLPRPPWSRFYAAEVNRLLESGKPVIYVGSREDLGTIPALDRFFTARTIAFADGSSAQELSPLPGDTVLAAENGRPWAIRHGKLLIVSRSPVTPPQHNRNLGFLHLKKEWIHSVQE